VKKNFILCQKSLIENATAITLAIAICSIMLPLLGSI